MVVGFGIPLRQLTKPAVGTARWMGTTAAASMRRTPAEEEEAAAAAAASAASVATNGKNGRSNGKTVPAGAVTRPDRRVGRRGRRDPGRRAEHSAELSDVRAGPWRRDRRDARSGPVRRATSTT